MGERERLERRLAAVMAADVVGFSALMSRDEEATFARITALRDTILEREIRDHRGRLVKTTGDGVLAEFASPVEAVRCAQAIQARLAEREAGAPSQDALKLRIGINLGDIIIAEGDVYGDGVNVAARLEALCDPGGIFISGKVLDEVEGKIEAAFESRGERQVKNIPRPVRVYAVKAGPGAPIVHPPSIPGKPSLAVLPFANLGGDPEQEYFADGMVEEIITGLSRIPWLTVIARNSSFAFKGRPLDVRAIGRELNVRYLLEGSVRKAGDRVRIATQLVEAESAAQLWADRFEGALTDVFDLQDRITEGVVGAIEPTLRKAEIARAKRKRPDDLDAYDLYLRALAHMYEVAPQARDLALSFIEKALALNPDYAEAHGVAAWCYLAKALWQGGMPDDYRERALHHARAVQALQSEDATTLAHAAIALALATRDYGAAVEMIDRAIALNPNSVQAHGHGAVINTWAGNYARTMALADRALRLSPLDPLRVMPLAGKAGAFLMMGEHAAAVSTARTALQIYPTHTPSFLIAIASLMRLGRSEEAKAMAQEFMAVHPTYRIRPRWPVLERFCEELRGAGLPG